MGGLGSAVSEVLLENGYKGKFKRIGINDQYCSVCGRTDYLMKINNLNSESIANKILN
jgi:transketolase